MSQDQPFYILGTINIAPLLKAQKVLEEALENAQSDLEKTGAIKAFEFCYELAWKTLKKVLYKKGIEANNPRDVFREAAISGLIDNPKNWFDFIEKRNLTVYTYDADYLHDLYEFLPEFADSLNQLTSFLKTYHDPSIT